MFASLVFLALTSPGIVFGATYDCGPGYATFAVANCSGGICNVAYANPGQPTRRIRMYQSAIATAISRGCHPAKSAQDYRNEAAQYEARARALLSGSSRPPTHPSHVAAVPVARGAGPVATGPYICSTYTDGHLEVRAGLDFTIKSSSTYSDAAGHPGTYSMSGDIIRFMGDTGIGGHRAKYTQGVPHSANPPHVSFIMADGNTNDTCQPA